MQAVTGLTPGTTYYYCAIASNAAGKGFGTVTPFTALSPTTPPTVTSEAATAHHQYGRDDEWIGEPESRGDDRLGPIQRHNPGLVRRHVWNPRASHRRHPARRGR